MASEITKSLINVKKVAAAVTRAADDSAQKNAANNRALGKGVQK
jgi:hypothetical protein